MEPPFHTTFDHEVIRKWAEARGGKPAMVRRTITNDPEQDLGVIRIMFADEGGNENLEETTWPKLFRVFEEKNLAFAYNEKTRDGKLSRHFEFVHRPGSKSSPAGEAARSNR